MYQSIPKNDRYIIDFTLSNARRFYSSKEDPLGTIKGLKEKMSSLGAFHSTKNTEISGPKLNGTVKIPGKVFENLGIRFECTLFSGKSE